MLFGLFMTYILVNCILYTAKSVNISNPQNLVCGQIRTFLMSALLVIEQIMLFDEVRKVAKCKAKLTKDNIGRGEGVSRGWNFQCLAFIYFQPFLFQMLAFIYLQPSLRLLSKLI